MTRLLGLFLMTGCGMIPIVDSAGGSSDASNGPLQHGLTVHEWGTYTSVLSSKGEQLSGMHHEEEALPSFVYSRSPGDKMHNKGFEGQLSGVTQKLETPVLYFYSDQPGLAVKVKVDFPKGIVSQYYPNCASFEPPLGKILPIAQGKMEWQGKLMPGLTGFPTVKPEDIWAPSRKVASVPVQIGNEKEQFIFYRGLGTFDVPLKEQANDDGSVTLTNASQEKIAHVFLLRLHQEGGAIKDLGSLSPSQSFSHVWPPAGGKETPAEYLAHASDMIAAALVESGLYQDEARAMVDTWQRSYFLKEGTRFLYLAPRAWTDQLLPIAIEPAPTSLVRTLVGRIEVLSSADEAGLVDQVSAAANSKMAAKDLIAALGRFAEPKLRRAAQLIKDPTVKSYCDDAITVAAEEPSW